ncbi:FecCD family ABC transporter permease [Thermohalobacter berrensis]|uniref:Iron ABC transporter n=1 Tax=Thermohalobacter berrensis TaxID=99594 RepID=A0A419T4H9_9FIRM|nr:iron ABC transporter permease [Thermohalobacter berrensis]RKD32447.1 iron ABC transporter [Thermohalobacter berrensis]
MNFILTKKAHRTYGLFLIFFILIGCIFSSIILGITDTSWHTLIDAYTNFNGSNEHIIIKNLRVPRALIATVVGASLAISGVLIQAITRNPLSSPSILGINAGAAFAVVFSSAFLSVSSLSQYIWIAFIGAGIGSLSVYLISTIGNEDLSSLKIVLSGAAITALFSSFTQSILALNEKELDEVLFWLTGSVQGRNLEMLASILPYTLIGIILAFILSKPLNILSLGENMAKGLGLNVFAVKISTLIVVILLAGSSVAISGPIGFIGIIVPHIARFFVGFDYRWNLLYSAFLGSILLLLADIISRYIIAPMEVPVGAMTAIIGTPFFIFIARKGLKNE